MAQRTTLFPQRGARGEQVIELVAENVIERRLDRLQTGPILSVAPRLAQEPRVSGVNPMKEQPAFFEVKKVAETEISEALAKLVADPEVSQADKDTLSKVNWSKIPFTWFEAETKEEALQGVSDKDLLEMLNSIRKANAKSKEYQRITKPFRPDPKDPVVKRENLIKQFVKDYGVDSETAARTIDSLIASGKARLDGESAA